MKIAHFNAGNEYGGGLVHIVSLLQQFKNESADLILLEEGPVAKAAREQGINVIIFQQKHQFDLSVLFKLKKWINNQDYAIIHTHGPRANTLLYFIHQMISSKWVSTIHSHPLHDFEGQGFKGSLFEKINCLAIGKADGLIAVSNEIKSVLEDLSIPESKMTVIFNGIAFTDFHSKELSTKASPLFSLITVGRLHPVKGYTLLMEALKDIPFQQWEWIICGDGDQENTLRQMSIKYNLSDKVTFRGWLSPRDVEGLLKQSNVLVHPSLSESFPLVILEAADKEVPVIATDVGDVREILIDSKMGWLIPPDNIEALKKALIQAHQDYENNILSIKGKALKEWTVQFSIEKQALRVSETYKKIIDQSRM